MAAVYKQKGNQFWQTDIWIGGRKFSRSTKCTSRREAEAAAKEIKARLKTQIADETEVGTSLAINDVAGRYMTDVGDHHAGADNTRRLVALLIIHFGPDKLLTDITHDDVLGLRRWRRGHKVGTGKSARPISAYTINDTVEQLKKLFTYAKTSGGKFRDEPKWKALWLDEPKEHVRELAPKEELNLDGIREDYQPLIRFALFTGKRKAACMTLEWSQVKWDQGIILMTGKGRGGGKPITVTITKAIRDLLWPLRGNHPTRVFTFIAERTVDKVIKGHHHYFVAGKHYPITRDGLRRAWDTWRKANGLTLQDGNRFRFHDLRHDFASKLLRSVPTAEGIKIVQQALDHADIGTTLTTYSHLLEGQVGDAIERLAQSRLQAPRPKLKAVR